MPPNSEEEWKNTNENFNKEIECISTKQKSQNWKVQLNRNEQGIYTGGVQEQTNEAEEWISK